MLAPWKKSYDQPIWLDSILKSRDITLPTKVHLVKAMVLPVVMYGRESWTIKKAKHQRIDAFELWCWRRLSILKEISPGCSLEGLMLKLKLQYFGHLMYIQFKYKHQKFKKIILSNKFHLTWKYLFGKRQIQSHFRI